MNYFIFQAVDKTYPRFLEDLRPTHTVRWMATRYRTRMTIGDLVYLWRGGDAAIRGIYGWGRIVGPPAEDAPAGEFRVPVTYERRLSQHVSVSDIKSDYRLIRMQILNLPVGTNFQISLNEAQAIASHINDADRPALGVR